MISNSVRRRAWSRRLAAHAPAPHAQQRERESVDTPLYLYVGTRQLACIVACVHTCMVHACMQMQQPLAVPLLPPLASAKLTACRPVPSQEKLHPGTVPDTRAPLP